MKIARTLKDAIDTCYDRAKWAGSDSPRAYAEFQDYLSQKFSAAYMRAESQEELNRLKLLWDKIINDEGEKR